MKFANVYSNYFPCEALDYYLFRDCDDISLLILSEFNQINLPLFPWKSSKNHRFSDEFTGKIKIL